MSDENDLSIAYLAGYHKAKDELKNRTCENCKHAIKEERKFSDVLFCGDALKYRQVQPDFGCNKFVSTDTKSH